MLPCRKEIPLTQRILGFAFLWFLAAGVCAIFAENSIEAGPPESEFLGRLQLFCLAPLLFALGVASTFTEGRWISWQSREHAQLFVFSSVLLIFVVHAIVTLSRRDRSSFLTCLSIQAALLAGAVASTLHFFHHEASIGHG